LPDSVRQRASKFGRGNDERQNQQQLQRMGQVLRLAFSRPNTIALLHRHHKDAAVADLAGARAEARPFSTSRRNHSSCSTEVVSRSKASCSAARLVLSARPFN
jgi:hypothetical protein